MKQTIGLYDFHRAFEEMKRTNFSHDGQKVLFGYLEQYEENTGEEIELDVIALCCDFAELSWYDAARNYEIDLTCCDDDADKMIAVRKYLELHTTICGETDDSFVFHVI